MNGATAIFRKEFIDSLRERRSLISALVFGPLLGPALFAVLINFTVSQQVDEALQPIEVPVLGGMAADNLVGHLHERLIDVDHDRFGDIEAMRTAVRDDDTKVGLVIDEGFAEALGSGAPARLWIVSDQSDSAARSKVSRLRSALLEYGRMIGAQRLQLRGIDAQLARPFAVLTDDVSTPSGRSILLLGMMTYFLLFATLLGGTQVAIDTTAGERERGTLEPLLTLPVSRRGLVLGKIAATFVFMAVSQGISIVSFAVAVRFLPFAEIGMTANLSPLVCAQIYMVMLPFAVLGAGLMSVVASFTKTFREAQTYTSVAMVVPPLPIVLVVLNPVQASTQSMLVPSLSQHLLATALIKGDGIDLEHLLVSAASTLAVGALCAFATVRRYESERLLV